MKAKNQNNTKQQPQHRNLIYETTTKQQKENNVHHFCPISIFPKTTGTKTGIFNKNPNTRQKK